MGIKELYKDNLPKLQNEYGDVSVMQYVNNKGAACASTKPDQLPLFSLLG